MRIESNLMAIQGSRITELSELVSLVEAAKHKEAIALGQQLLDILPEHENQITSYISLAYYGLGDLHSAIFHISKSLSRGYENIDDLHRACEYFIITKKYNKAEEFATKLIDRFQDDTYYLSNTYLMRAYVRCLLSDFVGARMDLDKVEADEEPITWLRDIPVISRATTRKFIDESGSK